MKKALIYSYYSDDYIPLLNKKFKDVIFITCKNEEDFPQHLKEAEIFITINCTKEILNMAPKLKWIQSLRAGVDNYPLDEIHKRGIILTNARGVHTIHMAEYAIASMINLARNFHLVFRNQLKGKWDRSIPQGEIYGATVGIIGLGTIGKEIAKKASLLGMHVIGIKNKVEPVDFVEKVYGPEEINKIFEESDYIINLLPYTPQTEKLINGEHFKLMKKTACFINMGRGKTVNEEDLIDALKNKSFKAMVSDVFFNEPLPKDSPLWNMENVIITPHVSGESVKYMYKVLEIIEHNLKVYINNRGKMINLINLDKGY